MRVVKEKNGSTSLSDIKNLKEELLSYFLKKKIIHVNIKKSRNKVIRAESKITGIYDHFLTLTSFVGDYEENFTINYVEILNGVYQIEELQIDFPPAKEK